MPCDFQQCGILTSVNSDEPVQTPFKVKTPNAAHSHRIFKRLAKVLISLSVCAPFEGSNYVVNLILGTARSRDGC